MPINYVFVIISYIYSPWSQALPMQPDSTILSILDRYENNQPVTPEEKAVLHKWLITSLRARNLSVKPAPAGPLKVKALRKKIVFWQYVFLILMLIAVALTLYLFTIRTGQSSTREANDNLHRNNQEIRKPG